MPSNSLDWLGLVDWLSSPKEASSRALPRFSTQPTQTHPSSLFKWSIDAHTAPLKERNHFFRFEQTFHQESWLVNDIFNQFRVMIFHPMGFQSARLLMPPMYTMLHWDGNSGYLTADSYYKNRCLHSWRHAWWEAFFCSRHSSLKGVLKLTFSNRLFSFWAHARRRAGKTALALVRTSTPDGHLSSPCFLIAKQKITSGALYTRWKCYSVVFIVWHRKKGYDPVERSRHLIVASSRLDSSLLVCHAK